IKKAGDIFQIRKDSLAWYMTITAIGMLWANDKKYEKALVYYNQAMKVATAMKNRYAIEVLNEQIGLLYQAKGRLKEALASLLQTWDYFRSTDDVTRQSHCAREVAGVYFQLKNYPMALKYASTCLQKAQAVNSKAYVLDAASALAAIYEAQGNTRYALK